MPLNAAVLTGDIVNSTKLKPATERKMQQTMLNAFTEHKSEFYRGDSFQVYMKKPEASLRLALLCRTIAISFSETERGILSDIRISIGLGIATAPVRSLGSAKGEAFLLSGRAFDKLAKTETRLSISINNDLAQAGLQVVADYINAIYKGMTAKQAEVIIELLKGQTQQEVAIQLLKSKSTIHQHVTAGRWGEIENLLLQFENIVNHSI